MPAISMFYGILIYMYYFDNKKHHLPHIHAKFGENEAILSIENGETLEGELPSKKMKLVQAWLEIHNDELMADWQLAIQGEQLFKIEPLK
jgi:hypothetical protein